MRHAASPCNRPRRRRRRGGGAAVAASALCPLLVVALLPHLAGGHGAEESLVDVSIGEKASVSRALEAALCACSQRNFASPSHKCALGM